MSQLRPMFRTSTRRLALGAAPLAMLVATTVACNGGGAETTPTADQTPTAVPSAPDIDALNAALQPYVAWEPPVKVSADTRALSSGTFDRGNFRHTCQALTPEAIVRFYDEFPAFAFQGSVLPGLLIEGEGLVEGEVRPVPLRRAPLTLSVNLASESANEEVASPDSASLQQAVSNLQRQADSRLTGINIVPADINYVRKEAFSFEQTSLDLGVSLHYQSPLVSAGLDVAFSTETSVESRTLLVRLYQPMYVISFVDDFVVLPSDLVTDVGEDSLASLTSSGRVGDDNKPVYIKSVTYGRMMLFTMTSKTVASAEELQVAMTAAYGNIGGSATVDEKHLKVLSESEVRMVAIGGDSSAAEAAIRSGDPGQFFSGTDTANAAPLTFRAATMNGTPVAVGDQATVKELRCTRETLPDPQTSYRVEITNIRGTASVWLNGVNKGERPGTATAEGRLTVTLDPGSTPAGNQTFQVRLTKDFCVDARIQVKVYVDNQLKDERAFHGCAFDLRWDYGINKDTARFVAPQ